MKQKFGIVNARREKILSLLAQHSPLKVQDLAERLNVSPLTIRRDFDELASRGLIDRFHGGAAIITPQEIDNSSRIERYKKAIAQKAAEYLQEGDTVFINSSSTALSVLNHIHDKHITIITNNGKVLNLDVDPKIRLVLTGGDIAFPKETLTGEFTLNNLSKVAANKAIMGVSGLTPDMGMTTSTLDEIAVNEMMLSRTSGEKIIVTDSSKLGANSTFVIGQARQITRLITDQHAPLSVVENLAQYGVEVIQV